MAAIDRVTIEGFKSIASLRDLELRPINMLIGANGSGKSNFLEALRVMRLCVVGGASEYVQRAGGADRVLHFGSERTERIEFAVRFVGDDSTYRMGLAPSDGDETDSGWRFPASNRSGRIMRAHASVRERGASLAESPARRAKTWRHYHFHNTSFSARIKKFSDLHDNRHLRPDGSNLASFLYLLRERYRGSYDLIRKTVRLVAPFFDDFVLEPPELNPEIVRLDWRHVGSDAPFLASSLSDGSLRFVALTTVLLQPTRLRPSVIVLDEPELGIHPYAVTFLAAMIKRTAADSQVVTATQSPRLLDHFEAADVLVADREGGATQIRRLDDLVLREWLDEYSLGELWEKNELGGRPAPERTPAGAGERTGAEVMVFSQGRPLADASVVVHYPNKTFLEKTTDSLGRASFQLHADLPMTAFCAAPGHAGHVERTWRPREPLQVQLDPLPGGGSAVFTEQQGHVPGLDGRLNPILDNLDRTYLYTDNIAIGEDGETQPVHFYLSQPLLLVDKHGSERIVRFVDIFGKSALVEYEAGKDADGRSG